MQRALRLRRGEDSDCNALRERFLSQCVDALSLCLSSNRKSLMQFRRNAQIELTGVVAPGFDPLLLANLKKNVQ